MIAAPVHAVSGVLLLRRMRGELLADGRLSPVTVAWMYACYAKHTAATAWVLRDEAAAEHPRLARTGRLFGAVLALCGGGLSVAGISRFTGAGQLSGTHVEDRIDRGVYRYSRNPQYTGIVLTLVGLALARRSPGGLALASGVAAAYRWWVPVEEAHLEAVFGEDYRRYRHRTPRWLGPPTDSLGVRRTSREDGPVPA